MTPEEIAALKAKNQVLLDYLRKPENEKFVHANMDESGNVKVVQYLSEDIKSNDSATAEIVHFISTPRIDHAMDVVNPFGIDGEALDKNRSVFYNHRFSGAQDLPIGQMLWRKSDRTGVITKTRYAVNEYPFAGDVYRLVSSGYLRSFSIGFMPKEWEFLLLPDLLTLIAGKFDISNSGDFPADTKVLYYKAWGCHEYSQVGVPMNMDAVTIAMAKKIASALDEKNIITSNVGRELFSQVVREAGLSSVSIPDQVMASLGTINETLSKMEKRMEVIEAKTEMTATILEKNETTDGALEGAPLAGAQVGKKAETPETVGKKSTSEKEINISEIATRSAAGAVSRFPAIK